MADRLARIYGTEEDKVNCPFYHKIGACRHGDRCSRLHNKPLFSQSVSLLHMYQNPMSQLMATGGRLNRDQERQLQQDFENFYIDVFDEVTKFGEVEELHICDNLADHLVGNVYIKYTSEEDAQKAMEAMQGRWYGGRQLATEYSPVTEFDQARCRQYDERNCNRGGYCNFMHMKQIPREMLQDLMENQPARMSASSSSGRGGGRDDDWRRGRSRSRSRDRRERSRSRDRYRDDRDRDRERDRR